MRFNFLPSGLLDQAVDAVSFRQAAAALASPELAMLQRRRGALRAPVGISSPVPGVAPPAPDPGIPMDPATRMAWQRVDALQRWNAFDDAAMAQGNRQADWVLNQARVPHAGRLDPMQRPVGPGVVAPSMLPDMQPFPEDWLERHHAFVRGTPYDPAAAAASAAAHDAAVNRIEQKYGDNVNLHDLRRQNFNIWRDRNATAVSQGQALRERKRQAQQEYAQRRMEAANPAVARDRMLEQLQAAAPQAPGGNIHALAMVYGPEAAARMTEAQANAMRASRELGPREQLAANMIPSLLQNGQWREANEMYGQIFGGSLPTSPEQQAEAGQTGPFTPAPADPERAAERASAGDPGDVYDDIAPMLDSVLAGGANDAQVRAMLEANGITPEHLWAFAEYSPTLRADAVGPLSVLPWLVAGESWKDMALRERRQKRVKELLPRLYPSYAGQTP